MTSKIKQFLTNKYTIYALIVIIVLFAVFHEWFFKKTILTDGDWYYYTQNSLLSFRLDYFHLWLGDQNFGRMIIDIGQAPTYALYGLLAKIGIPYSYSERMIHMIPAIVILPIGSFLLLNIYTKYVIAIAVGSAVLFCNTYFLQLLTGDITLATAYAFAPLVLFCFIKFENTKEIKYIILSAVFAFIMSSYEPRILLVEMLSISTYYFGKYISTLSKSIFINIRQLILLSLPFLLFATLNLFWILGLYVSGGDSSNAVLSRSLFGNEFFLLVNSITLSQPFWTGGRPESFVYHRILINQWIIPILGLLSLIFNNHKKVTFYFVILVILGVFLGKQVSAPLGVAYPWLYSHVPGFNAFREGSKFYLLSALGFAGLTTLLIDCLLKSKLNILIKVTTAAVPLVLLSLNLIPFANNNIGTTTTPRIIPTAYIKWNQYLESDKNYSRVLWLPNLSRWADSTEIHPNVTAVSLSQTKWNIFDSNSLSNLNSYGVPNQDQITGLYAKSEITNLLNDASIKYLVIPIRDTQNDDDFFKDYSDDRNFYVDTVKSIKGIKEVTEDFNGLKVYENPFYKPYFSTASTLSSINTFSDLENYQKFQNSILNQNELHLSLSSEIQNTDAPLRKIDDLSTGISRANISNGSFSIKRGLNKSNINTIYINNSLRNYSYQVQNDSINFSINNNDYLSVNSQPQVGLENDDLSYKFDENQVYYLAMNDNLYEVDKNSSTSRNIGFVDGSLTLYGNQSSENILPDGSFEDGLWEQKVEDCNNYDNNPHINMALDKVTALEGLSSLKLGAATHTACTTSSPISVKPNSEYRFKYDYRISGGQRAGYDLVFNDSNHTTISKDQINGTDRWYKSDVKFKVPDTATEVQIRLKAYPDDHKKQDSSVNYDGVEVQPINNLLQVSNNSDMNYKSIELQKETSDLNIQNSNLSYGNLISNPSLENGLWQNNVGDCNNYDSKPVISMVLDNQHSTDGEKSLELSAERHTACTGPLPINVQEGYTYLLSFDYQSPNSTVAGYNLTFNDQDGSHVGEYINIKDNKWHTYSKVVTIPFGATSTSLTVYSYSNDLNNIENLNRYDNFSLIRIPPINRYYLVSEPKDFSKLKTPTKIEYNLVSPTKKYISVIHATTPFYLNMSESYHPKWTLELNDEASNGFLSSWVPWAKPVKVNKYDHFNYNGFLNSWYIDPAELCASNSSACTKNLDGSYNLNLITEFTPQRYLYIGLIISGMTMLGCIGFLSYIGIRRLHVKQKRN